MGPGVYIFTRRAYYEAYTVGSQRALSAFVTPSDALQIVYSKVGGSPLDITHLTLPPRTASKETLQTYSPHDSLHMNHHNDVQFLGSASAKSRAGFEHLEVTSRDRLFHSIQSRPQASESQKAALKPRYQLYQPIENVPEPSAAPLDLSCFCDWS